MHESNPEEIDLLPAIPPAPKPPSDNDDIEGWQAHIMAMDKYILDMNKLVEEIEQMDFPKAFKEKMALLGVNIDEPKALPQNVLENIASKVNQLLHKFREANQQLGIEASHAQKHQPVLKSRRNIQSI